MVASRNTKYSLLERTKMKTRHSGFSLSPPMKSGSCLSLAGNDQPITIHDTIFSIGKQKPNLPFVHLIRGAERQTISFSELAGKTRAYANWYRSIGLGKGSTVALLLPFCSDIFPAFAGAMAIGALPSIFPTLTAKQDPHLYWSSHAAVFQKLDISLVLTDPGNQSAIASHLPQVAALTRCIPQFDSIQLSAAFDPCSLSADDAAFLQHSSGTTGLKKGVLLSHRAVMQQVAAYSSALGLQSTDVIATWLPLYHDMGLISCFMLPALKGISIAMMDPLDWAARPHLLLDIIETYRATLCWLPNFAFNHIARCAPLDRQWRLDSVRALINCSEPCKPESFDMFAARFSSMGLKRNSLQACYAMAENVFAVTQTCLALCPRSIVIDRDLLQRERRIQCSTNGGLKLLSCGRPIETASFRIADEEGLPIPEKTVGEIHIGGSTLFGGYFRQTSAARMKDGWYATGDLGFVEGNELFVLGRLDDILIIHGNNIYAHDVEQALNDNTAIKAGRCVALGYPNNDLGSLDLAIVAETQEHNAAENKMLIRRISEVVNAAVGIAPSIIRLERAGWLVKTTSGKIARKECLKKFLQANNSSSHLQGERNE
jgi:fatty-acyl-CoA synthase